MLTTFTALALTPLLQTSPELLIDLDANASSIPVLIRSSESEPLAAFAGGLLFAGERAGSGRELMWIEDVQGAEAIVLNGPPSEGPSPSEWLEGVDLGNGRALLLTETPEIGVEVRSTDGSSAGTLALSASTPGLAAITLDALAVWAGRGWFLTEPAPGQLQLWSTDGTAADFGPEATILGTGTGASFSRLFVAGGNLFISTDLGGVPQLFVLNQLGATPVDLGPIGLPTSGMIQSALEFDGRLWFVGESPGEGRELWSSDGTPPGTGLAFDLRPGPPGSDPDLFDADTSGLWLGASADGVGTELFRVDLTGSISQAADLTAGPGGEQVLRGALLGDGRLVFTASDSQSPFLPSPLGFEPYLSDGTPAGSGLLVDLLPGPSSSGPVELTAFNGRVAFAAAGSTWITDGSASGTIELGPPTNEFLTDQRGYVATANRLWWPGEDSAIGSELVFSDGITPGGAQFENIAIEQVSASSNPVDFSRLGDRLLFAADTAPFTGRLWSTDGTAAQTELVSEVEPTTSFLPGGLGVDVGTQLLFRTTAGFAWATDSSDAGTFELTGLAPAGTPTIPSDYVSMGDYALFLIDPVGTDQSPALARTDGTPSGTSQISSAISFAGQNFPELSVRLGERLIFAGFDELAGQEPWVTDGTSAGTVPLADLAPGSLASNPEHFVRLGNLALFTASSDGVDRQLYRTDGTAAGTSLVVDFLPGPGGIELANLTPLGDQILFFAGNESLGSALWRTDGTASGTTLVDSVQLLDSIGAGSQLTRVGDVVVFVADDSPTRLWRSDGTASGTVPIPAPAESGFSVLSPAILEVGDSGAGVFAANSQQRGRELWLLPADGSAPQPLPETWPGTGDSDPTDLIEFDGRIWFAANNPAVGREIFSLSLASLGFGSRVVFGQGCSNFGFEPSIGLSGGAGLGDSPAFELSDADPSALAFLFVSPALNLVDLSPDCPVYLGAPLLLGSTVANGDGSGSFSTGVPNNAALVGLALYFQWATTESGGPISGALATSNALELVIGP